MNNSSFSSLNDIYPDEDFLHPYLAAVFESKGIIRINEQGGLILSISGNKNFLLFLKTTLDSGTLISTPYHHLQIFGNNAYFFLKKIYPYLLIYKDLIKLAFEYQEHINNRKGSKIDAQEHQYRMKVTKKIKNFHSPKNAVIKDVPNWIFPYFIGFFDYNAKINIKEKNNEYWLNLRLKSKYESIIYLFQQLFNLGHIYQIRSLSYRWELNYSDAYELLTDIYPYLFQTKIRCNNAIEFYRFYEKAKKPLNEKDMKHLQNFIHKNQIESKELFSEYKSLTILICEKLNIKIDKIVKQSNSSRSSIVRDSIRYFYLNESKISNYSDICINKSKDHQINTILDNGTFHYVNEITGNRSELIRRMIKVYLDYLSSDKSIEPTEDVLESDSNLNDNNPLKLLKKLDKN